MLKTSSNGSLVDKLVPVDTTNESVFQCPVCLDICTDPVSDICQHFLCNGCFCLLKKTHPHPSCPICRCQLSKVQTLSSQKTGALWRIYQSTKVKCPKHEKDGCPWVGEISSIAAHQKLCAFEPILCPQQCKQYVLPADLEPHQMIHCTNRMEVCSQCCKLFRLSELEKHKKICPMLVLTCKERFVNDGCSETFTLEKLVEHRSKCAEKNFPCTYHHLGCRFFGKKDAITKHELEKKEEHLLVSENVNFVQSSMIGHLLNDCNLMRYQLQMQQEEVNFLPTNIIAKPGLNLVVNLPVDVLDERSGLWGHGFVKSIDAPSRASIQLTSDFGIIVMQFPEHRDLIEHFNSQKLTLYKQPNLQKASQNIWGINTRFRSTNGHHWSLASAHQIFSKGSLLEVKIGEEGWMLVYLFDFVESEKMVLKPLVRGAYRPFLNATIDPLQTAKPLHEDQIIVTSNNADKFVFGFPNIHVPWPLVFTRPMFAFHQSELVKLEHRQKNGKDVNVIEIPSMKTKNVPKDSLQPVMDSVLQKLLAKDWHALMSIYLQSQPALEKTDKSKKRKEPPVSEKEAEEEEEEVEEKVIISEKKEQKETKEEKEIPLIIPATEPISVKTIAMKPRPPSAYRLFLNDQRNGKSLFERPTIKAVAAKWKLLTVDHKRPYVIRNRNLMKEWRSKI